MCNLAYGGFTCVLGGVGNVASDVAEGAADKFFTMIANGARDLLGTVSTFWMEVPDPQVASQSPGGQWVGNSTITSVQGWLSPVTLAVFLVTTAIVMLKIAHDTRRAGEGASAIVRTLVTTLATAVPLMAVTMLGLQAGDEFCDLVSAGGPDR